MVCPACSGKSVKQIDSFDWYQDGEGYLPNQYKLVNCNHCGLWFKDSLPTEFELIKYYESLKVEPSRWEYSRRLPHEIVIDKIINRLPEKSKILDVGCWTGRLLEPHKSSHQVFGIEPNLSSSAIAQAKGLHMLGNQVNEETLNGQVFDCITIIDVFEHLRNPVDVIELLFKHLSVNGKLIIVTGRTDCLPVSLARSTYWYFSKCPDHLVFLNRKFLKWLNERLVNSRVKSHQIRHSPLF